MSIQISFMTILVKKSAVKRHYQGGENGFQADYPNVAEDGYLFGIASMSGGEVSEILDSLEVKGLDTNSACAVCDTFCGPIQNNPHFEFREVSQSYPPRWEAQLISDDPQVLAEDGVQLIRWLMRQDQSFIPPSSGT